MTIFWEIRERKNQPTRYEGFMKISKIFYLYKYLRSFKNI